MRVITVNTIDEFCEYLGLSNSGKIFELDLETEENDCDKFKRKLKDAEVLCAISANAKGNCLDLGTSYGRSAYRIATNLQSNFKVFTVNILPEQVDASSGSKLTHLLNKDEIGSYFSNRNIINIVQIYADTSKWDIPTEFSDISLCYIDAAHDTELVYNDSKLIFPLVIDGGYICWHDFNPDLRYKYDWIDSAMRGVEWFMEEFSLEGEIVHLKNSWVGVYKKSRSHEAFPSTRVGLVIDKAFHDSNRWVSATTPYLVNKIMNHFKCSIITSQVEYELSLPEVDVILSMEPGWAAPLINFNRTKAIKDELSRKCSFILYSDPHKDKWREDYFLKNNLDYILAYYDSPTKYHFSKVPHNRIVHFPWCVPDHWIPHNLITCKNQNKLAIFGAQHHDAYTTRNWCRQFSFVENNNLSGVENKILSSEEYILKLQTYDAAIAAGSEDLKYRLTMPKYFEIPATGSLLFAQVTDDLEKLGFRHMENCVTFSQSSFESIARDYFADPESYLSIRNAGRELIRQRHSLSTRVKELSAHINMAFNSKLSSINSKTSTFLAAHCNCNDESHSIGIELLNHDNDVTNNDPTIASIFKSPEAIYLASADRMNLVLANLQNLKQIGPLNINTYVSVIGGLSGLNYLLNITPSKIVLFDINSEILRYAELILEIISLSSNPKEFISRVFSRSVDDFLAITKESDLTFNNQTQYLAQPIQENILSETMSKLSSSAKITYNEILSRYLSGNILDGVRNCRRLLPCWPLDKRVPVGGGQSEGYNDTGELEPNTNTFFYGYGWLASKEAYNRVKNILITTPIQLTVVDILQTSPESFFDLTRNNIIHISNIDDWFPSDWTKRMMVWKNQIDQYAGRLIVISSHNGISVIQPDPHLSAYMAIKPHIVGNKIVEVTHKTPWGFHEFDRINVTTEQYISHDYHADTTILHILIGEGISKSIFNSIYNKALNISNNVIILEHNKLSKDWKFQDYHHFVDAIELRNILEIDTLKESYATVYFQDVKGLLDDYRNILFVVTKSTHDNSAPNLKILIFFDEEGWAWWHRSHNIKSNISYLFDIDIKKIGSPFNHLEYDLIVLFEAYMYNQISNVPSEKVIIGSSTLKTLPSALYAFEVNNFAALVVNNKEAYNKSAGDPYVYCCENGVDETLFFYKYPRCDEFTVCWVGNNLSINIKGLDLIEEACRIAGVKLLKLDQSINVYNGNLLTQTQVRDTIYHNSTCYICASEMEGTPNPALEALSSGLPVISTRVGNMSEIIVDGFNGYLVDRTVEDIVRAINKLKDANLEEMSINARNSIINGWTWKDQVLKYERMFHDVAHKIKPTTNQMVKQDQTITPLVSVILPTYNRPDMLAIAIASILSQTMQSFEIIVVNDAGTDIVQILNQFQGKGKIRYIAHDVNQGLAAARNTGIRAARGKYIAYLDDDDTYYPNHLETLVNFLESNDCRVAYTDAVRAVQQNTGDGYHTVEKKVLYSRDFDYDAILVDNFIPVLCVIHEKECLSMSGMFDESLPRHEDWDLWIRMSRHERFAHLPTVTCEYTYRPDGIGMTSSTLPLFLKTYKAVYRKYEDLVAEKPCMQANRQKSLFNATFRTFQYIGERVEPFLSNSSVTSEMLAEITPCGAGFSQIKSCLTWRKTDSMPDAAAISCLEMALAIDSENHPARIALCERYLKTGRYADALRHMECLADANPNEPEFIKTRDALRRQIEADAPKTGFQEPTTYSMQTCDTPARPVTVSVFSLDAPQEACARIRLLSHFDALNGSIKANWGVISDGVKCTTNLDMIDQADIIVIQRFYPRKGTVPYIEKMLSSGKPVIYEVDDLLLDLPADNHLKSWAGETVDLFPWLLPRVTAITVSTPLLAKEFSVFNPSVHVIPNLADTELFQAVVTKKNGPVIIGFSGTVTHARDLKKIGEALFRVADRYGDKVAFSFMGLSASEFSSLPGFRFLDFERDYASYGKALSSSGIDIALVPLQDNNFNRCKSNIKWLEYSACGIAGVYADLPPYNTSIRHGASGVLVDDDPDKWFQAICLLIDHPELRQRIANQAKTEVLSHHSLKRGSQVLYTLYESMVGENICTKIA